MKRSVVVALAALLGGAAVGAGAAFFNPALNAAAGETGSRLERILHDTPHKARVRAAGGAVFGALAGLGLAFYAQRLQRGKSGS